MLKRVFACLLAACLAFAPAAQAAVAIDNANLGTSGNGATVTTDYLTLTGGVASGDALFVGFVEAFTNDTFTFSDSASDSYLQTTFTASGNHTARLAYVASTNKIPAPCTATGSTSTNVLTLTANTCTDTLTVLLSVSGTSIASDTHIASITTPWNGTTGVYVLDTTPGTVGSETITFAGTIKVVSGASGKSGLAAFSATGVCASGPLDTGVTAATSTNSISLATGTLVQTDEIEIGIVSATNTFGTFTQASGFTGLSTYTDGANENMQWAYRTPASSTAGDTYAPSWVNTRTGSAGVFSFKGACGGTTHRLLSSIGAG